MGHVGWVQRQETPAEYGIGGGNAPPAAAMLLLLLLLLADALLLLLCCFSAAAALLLCCISAAALLMLRCCEPCGGTFQTVLTGFPRSNAQLIPRYACEFSELASALERRPLHFTQWTDRD